MTSRRGKIARLPQAVREELNRRLQDGEKGEALLAWLNGHPEVKPVLQEHFGGHLMTPNNLSEWRRGGFQDWREEHNTVARTQELAADAKGFEEATKGRLMDSLTTVVATRYAMLLANWKNNEVTPEFRRKLRALGTLCHQVVRMRRGEINRATLDLEREVLQYKEQERAARAGRAQGAKLRDHPPISPEVEALEVEAFFRGMVAKEMAAAGAGIAQGGAGLAAGKGVLPVGKPPQIRGPEVKLRVNTA